MKPDLSQDGLHLLLKYDQTIGKFFWRKFRSGGRSNLEAGSFDRDGYIQIMISGRNERREVEILSAELRGSTAEFLGWLTGLVPPSEKENIPPEMRPAFDKMVGRLTEAAKRYASRQAAGPITTEQLDKLQFGKSLHTRPAAPQGREALEYRSLITRQMLRDEPETLFVFGDNMIARGLGGQAGEMRGEPNAVGIPTKQLPSMDATAFFRDGDLPRVRPTIDAAFLRLAFHILKGGRVVWPADGIGTGRAELKIRSPAIWQLIESGRLALTPAVAPAANGEIPERETAWLIERNGTYATQSQMYTDWSADPWRAHRFTTAREADNARLTLASDTLRDQSRVTEHVFINKWATPAVAPDGARKAGWAFAKQLSNALLKIRPLGGSELFVKRNDDYYADPEFCGKAIEELHRKYHDALSHNGTRKET